MEEIGLILLDRISEGAIVTELVRLGAIKESSLNTTPSSVRFYHPENYDAQVEAIVYAGHDALAITDEHLRMKLLNLGLITGAVVSFSFVDRFEEMDRFLMSLALDVLSLFRGFVECQGELWTDEDVRHAYSKRGVFVWREKMNLAEAAALERFKEMLKGRDKP